MPAKRPAIGIVRVSQVKGRDGDSFASPTEQRERIEAACERDGLHLIDVLSELDVSGGTPLAKRAGLRGAIERIEAGEAQVLVAAYFDRLVRSLRVQDELVSRVERAGGQVLAVDVGRVTNGSAGQWLSGTLLGAVSEYQRRTAAERSGDAQRRAVERGVLPFPNVPPGYRRCTDGTLEPHPRQAPIVADAFRMRADGATIKDVRAFLAKRGIKRSYHGVQDLLKSPIVRGEIRFGELVNPEAHEPIVDADTFRRVQRMSEKRGRRPSSDRLLARLGVLRCGSCGARMSVGTQTQHGRLYPFYRCPPVGDCTRRMAISAELVERTVVEHVQNALANVEGRASAQSNVKSAERELAQAQKALDGAIRTLAVVPDEPVARERLIELRENRDAAQDKLAKLDHIPASVTVNATRDWHLLTPEARRSLIAAVVDRVNVAPGRGVERIEIHDVAA